MSSKTSAQLDAEIAEALRRTHRNVGGPTIGWAKPDKSRVFHYFINSRSLCGKWSHFGSSTGAPSMQKRCKPCENLRPAGAN